MQINGSGALVAGGAQGWAKQPPGGCTPTAPMS